MEQTPKVNFFLVIAGNILINFSSLEWVELEETYSLSAVNTLQDAVHTIIKFLGLGPANSTEKVAEGTHTHTLVCSGMQPLLSLFGIR